MVGRPRLVWAAFLLTSGLAIAWIVRPVSAGPAVNPTNASISHDVHFANITDTRLTVSWITDAAIPRSGSVIYGLSPSTAFTSVAESAPPANSRGDIHVVQLTNLTASTDYYVAVVVGSSQNNNNGAYFKVTTGPALTPLANPGTVSGSVTLADHSAVSGALVSLNVLDNTNRNGSSSTTSATLATVTNSAGAWSMTMNTRTFDNSSVFSYTTDGTSDFVQYTVEAGALGNAGIQTVSLLLTGSGPLVVPNVSVSVQAATATPSVTSTSTSTPSGTVTPTMTSTPPPTLTATFTNAVNNLGNSGAPIATPPARAPIPVATPTSVPQPVFEPGPALVDQPPLSAPLAQPTPMPRVVSFTQTPIVNSGPGPVATLPPATQSSAPAAAQTLVSPLFPFGGTPIVLAQGAGQTTPGPFGTTIGTSAARITPFASDRPAVPDRPVPTSNGLPPVAALFLTAGLAAIGLGIAVVTIEISRRLRNS